MVLGPQHATSGSRVDRAISVGALILLCLEAYENAKFPIRAILCIPKKQRLQNMQDKIKQFHSHLGIEEITPSTDD